MRILTKIVEFAVFAGGGIFLASRLGKWVNELFSELLYVLDEIKF